MKPSRLKLLNGAQRRTLVVLSLFALGFLANSLYLFLVGQDTASGRDGKALPITYQAMLLSHIGLGLLLVPLALGFAVWHWPRARLRRTKGAVSSGLSVAAILLLLFGTGLLILTEANTRDNRWAFVAHQVLALLLPAMYLLHRLRSKSRPDLRTIGRALVSGGALTLLLIALHFIELSQTARTEAREYPRPALDAAVAALLPVADPHLPFHAIAVANPESPLAPSLATTRSGQFAAAEVLTQNDVPPDAALSHEVDHKGFGADYPIGAARCQECHPDTVAQWAASAHRFSSFNNPFYASAFELTLETHGKDRTQWCAGCHDPALLFTGSLQTEFDRKGVLAQTGLSCTSCHRIDSLHGTAGNGGYRLNDTDASPYLFDRARRGPLAFLNELLIKSRPDAHRAQMKKPFFETSEFCASCHKVSFHEFINDYRWLRGQNEYDAWQDSGVPLNNPMTWYEPKTSRSCQDCHMPKEAAPLGDVSARDGFVKSHRFHAANTALPALRGDLEQLQGTEHYLQNNRVSLSIFALRRETGPVEFDLQAKETTVRPGERIQVELVVRNRDVGHTFPGGTNDSNEGWIEFTVRDATGATVWQHGTLLADGQVDPKAHFYQAVLTDREGRRIDRRNALDIHTPIYANVIPPSTSDIVRYQFAVPAAIDAKGPLAIEAKLNWRKFNRPYTEFSLKDRNDLELPITVIAKDQVQLAIFDDSEGRPQRKLKPAAWMTLNDWAIGNLLDGDTKSAAEAFTLVTELAPERVDGWRNLARAHLREGDLNRAEQALRQATERAPQDVRTAFFWGMLLEARGGESLAKALEAYRTVKSRYPKSRQVLDRIAQVSWMLEEDLEVLKAALEILEIDPEHAGAHYQRERAYRRLAEKEPAPEKRRALEYAAEEAGRAFRYYKVDESNEAKSLAYRQAHQYDQKMSQRLIIHSEQP